MEPGHESNIDSASTAKHLSKWLARLLRGPKLMGMSHHFREIHYAEDVTRSVTKIISVGYEGRSVDELTANLADQGTDTLIDVRLNAISRKPGFSKQALRASLEKHGINYLHVRELGNPRENREGFRNGHKKAVEKYCRVVDSYHDRLSELAHEVRGRTIAFLCFESDHSTCHRRIVIERFTELIPGITRSITKV